jgi:hypothetical protein
VLLTAAVLFKMFPKFRFGQGPSYIFGTEHYQQIKCPPLVKRMNRKKLVLVAEASRYSLFPVQIVGPPLFNG